MKTKVNFDHMFERIGAQLKARAGFEHLKLALAGMLPELIVLCGPDKNFPRWRVDGITSKQTQVLDTEWLHVCWLVEQELSHDDQESYTHELSQLVPQTFNCGPGEDGLDIMIHRDFDVLHATWHQRTEALCKVKGIAL